MAQEHETAESARFVYRSWLDAGSDADAIKEHVLAWLKEHETAESAQLVYHSWLDAGGSADTIKAQVLAWLKSTRPRRARGSSTSPG